MALVDYYIVAKDSYILEDKIGNLNVLFCPREGKEEQWVKETFDPSLTSAAVGGFLLTDEQLTMFILKWGK